MVRLLRDRPDSLKTIACFCLMIHDDEYLMLSSRRILSSSMLLTVALEQTQKLREQTLQQPGHRLVQSPPKGEVLLVSSRRREDTEPEPSISQTQNKDILNK